jgi:hypothetical protein
VTRKGCSARRTRFDGRARTSPNKGFAHFDIAGAREIIDMGAEVAVGRASQPLETREYGSRFYVSTKARRPRARNRRRSQSVALLGVPGGRTRLSGFSATVDR